MYVFEALAENQILCDTSRTTRLLKHDVAAYVTGAGLSGAHSRSCPGCFRKCVKINKIPNTHIREYYTVSTHKRFTFRHESLLR